MLKRLFFILCALFMSIGAVSAESNGPNVMINGSKVKSDVAPIVINGTTYVPMRVFFEALEWDVQWNSENQSALAIYRGTMNYGLGFFPDYSKVMIYLPGKEHGRSVQIDGSPKLINGSLYVPFRAFGSLLGADVNWNQKTKTAALTVTKESIHGFVIGNYFAAEDPQSINQAPPSTPAPAPISDDAPLLFSADGKEFLGKLTSNEFDSDSIFNEFGDYGSEFSSDSIWNEFSDWGSEFSKKSAFNEFATEPPIIVQNGEIIGRLTINKFIDGAVSPYGLKEALEELGY